MVERRSETGTKANIIWRPHPGQQIKFHQRTEFEVLYGGARGGGKTTSLLMEGLRYIHHANYRGLILRRTTPELQEILDRSQQLFPQAIPGAKWRGKDGRWVFPSSAILRLGHMERHDDMYKYMGQEYQYIGFDELTHFHEDMYLFLMGSCRSTDKKIPARMRATSNPGNIGHNWVKKRFIDPAPPETIIRDEQTGLERVFIPSTVYDNPSLQKNDPMYVKRLEAIPDDNLRRMMLYGDWDVGVGTAFPDFRKEVHVIKPFVPPVEWKHFITVDWGFSRPFAVYWIAQDFMDRLYVYNEWYGAGRNERGEIQDNVGLRLNSIDVAIGVVQRCDPQVQYAYCVMDSRMWSPSGIDEASVASDFERQLGQRQIPVVKASQSPGSRLLRKQQFHARLRIRPDGKPGIFFTENCISAIRILPSLPLDKNNLEDVDTNAEDHCFDSIGYGLQTCPITERTVIGSDGNVVSLTNIEGFRQRNRFNSMRSEKNLVHTYTRQI